VDRLRDEVKAVQEQVDELVDASQAAQLQDAAGPAWGQGVQYTLVGLDPEGLSAAGSAAADQPASQPGAAVAAGAQAQGQAAGAAHTAAQHGGQAAPQPTAALMKRLSRLEDQLQRCQDALGSAASASDGPGGVEQPAGGGLPYSQPALKTLDDLRAAVSQLYATLGSTGADNDFYGDHDRDAAGEAGQGGQGVRSTSATGAGGSEGPDVGGGSTQGQGSSSELTALRRALDQLKAMLNRKADRMDVDKIHAAVQGKAGKQELLQLELLVKLASPSAAGSGELFVQAMLVANCTLVCWCTASNTSGTQ
jgi:hypothetical protein